MRIAGIVVAATLVIGATGAVSQTATGGGWQLKPENYAGYLGVIRVNDAGVTPGDFDDWAKYPAGTHFLIRYDMQLAASYHPKSNPGLTPTPTMCGRMVAEIIKNKQSMMGYRFFRAAKKSTWPTTGFPPALKAHLLRSRTPEHAQAVEISVPGAGSASALCYKTVIQNGDYAGQANKLEAWVAFKP